MTAPCPVLIPPRLVRCPDPPASPLGLCLGHLRQAADDLARLVPPPRPGSDPLPCSVPFTDLCTRCGRPGHDQRGCDA